MSSVQSLRCVNVISSEDLPVLRRENTSEHLKLPLMTNETFPPSKYTLVSMLCSPMLLSSVQL